MPHNEAGFRRLEIGAHLGAIIPQLRAHFRPTLLIAVMRHPWFVLENDFYLSDLGC
jgi:hypothetical protein